MSPPSWLGHMSPPSGSGDILFSLCVCLSVCLSVLLSVANCVKSCERNSSYLFFKLCRCYCQSQAADVHILGLIFVTFLQFELKSYLAHIDTGYYERKSHSLSWIFLKLCRCFCQGLKMCMTIGCNPHINFATFFAY